MIKGIFTRVIGSRFHHVEQRYFQDQGGRQLMDEFLFFIHPVYLTELNMHNQ